MEYRTAQQLEQIAQIHPEKRTMSQSERLERWAELLEREPNRSLRTFFETEYQDPVERAEMRCHDLALSVAFEDPVLRSTGLKDDTYGEARRFFELSDWELHRVVCYCHYGTSMLARTAAAAVRRLITEGGGGTLAGWARRYLARIT